MTSEVKKRKFHTAEFKAKVGLEALTGDKTINEFAQRHKVDQDDAVLSELIDEEYTNRPFYGSRKQEALLAHGKPEIFNSDQGSQFTTGCNLNWAENCPGYGVHFSFLEARPRVELG